MTATAGCPRADRYRGPTGSEPRCAKLFLQYRVRRNKHRLAERHYKTLRLKIIKTSLVLVSELFMLVGAASPQLLERRYKDRTTSACEFLGIYGSHIVALAFTNHIRVFVYFARIAQSRSRIRHPPRPHCSCTYIGFAPNWIALDGDGRFLRPQNSLLEREARSGYNAIRTPKRQTQGANAKIVRFKSSTDLKSSSCDFNCPLSDRRKGVGCTAYRCQRRGFYGH